jgi:hypothetical protein
MNRFEWILGAVLGVLLIVTLVLAALLVRARETAPAAEAIQTARVAYTLAEPVAQSWAGDAALLTIMGSQSLAPNAPLAVSDWSLIFYSPSRQATALISVVNGQAIIISTRSNSLQRRPANLDRWALDSQAVIEQFLAVGGREFITQEGATTLSLRLDVEEQVVWKSSLSARETGRTLSLWINANDGDLLDIRQSQ